MTRSEERVLDEQYVRFDYKVDPAIERLRQEAMDWATMEVFMFQLEERYRRLEKYEEALTADPHYLLYKH